MARAYESQSVLARLGFSDPDRGRPEHALACRYFCTPEVGDRLIHRFFQKDFVPELTVAAGPLRRRIKHLSGRVDDVELTHVLTKGQGQYRTTIGALDVVVKLAFEAEREYVDNRTHTVHRSEKFIQRIPLVIEVKVGRVSVDDMLHQVKTYREYIQDFVSDRSLVGLEGAIYIIASYEKLSSVIAKT